MCLAVDNKMHIGISFLIGLHSFCSHYIQPQTLIGQNNI